MVSERVPEYTSPPWPDLGLLTQSDQSLLGCRTGRLGVERTAVFTDQWWARPRGDKVVFYPDT